MVDNSGPGGSGQDCRDYKRKNELSLRAFNEFTAKQKAAERAAAEAQKASEPQATVQAPTSSNLFDDVKPPAQDTSTAPQSGGNQPPVEPPTNCSTAAPAVIPEPSPSNPFPTRHFEHLWSLGYGQRIIPIVPPGAEISEKSNLKARKADPRGKLPGLKRPDGTWSGLADWVAHVTTHDELESWQTMGAGAGLRVGNGLVCIDVDTLDREAVRIIGDVIDEHFGALPIRFGNAPKFACPIRITGDMGYQALDFGEPGNRVELLTKDKQFVTYGVHPKTGAPYHWPRPLVPFDDLPQTTPEGLRAFLADLQGRLPFAKPIIVKGLASGSVPDQDSLRDEPRRIKTALALIPNTAARFGYDDYVKVGYATKASFPPEQEAEALELFIEWALSWDASEDRQNSPENVEADWSRMKGPFRIGAYWLYELALECTPGAPDFRGAKHFISPIEGKPDGLNNREIEEERQKAEQTKAHRFRGPISFEDAAASVFSAPNPTLVADLIEQERVAVIVGPSNAGKSFFELALIRCIRTGTRFCGREVTKGPVLLIAAEGGAGMRKRIAAQNAHDPMPADAAPAHLWPDSFDFFVSRQSGDRVIAFCRSLTTAPLAIFIDTFAQTNSGEENSAKDMSTYLRECSRIAAETSATVIIVHHFGKAEKQRARGSNAQYAFIDTELEVTKTGNLSAWRTTKQRDLEFDPDKRTFFRVIPVMVGVNEHTGAIIKSASVDWVGEATAQQITAYETTAGDAIALNKLTPGERQVLNELERLSAERGNQPVDLASIATAIAKPDEKTNAARNRTRQYLIALKDKNRAETPDRALWVPVAAEADQKGDDKP